MSKQTITAGTTGNPVPIREPGATVTAIPGVGGTMLVQFSTSPEKDVDAGTATWQNWPSGTVAATTSDVLLGRVTAVRATATTANGVFEVA